MKTALILGLLVASLALTAAAPAASALGCEPAQENPAVVFAAYGEEGKLFVEVDKTRIECEYGP